MGSQSDKGAPKLESKSSSSVSSTSSLSSQSSSQSFGTSFGFFAHKQDPTLAFIANDIEFWGTAKDNLDEVAELEGIPGLSETDLVINCTGVSYAVRPFVSAKPKWLKVGGTIGVPEQIVLEWRDYCAPPKSYKLDFWQSVLEQSQAHGIKRIFCCCLGGHGRTGTALAALCLATGLMEEPDDAIDFIRTVYTDKAVESKSQEAYLWNLIYTEEEIVEKFGAKKKLDLDYDDEKEWYKWCSSDGGY